MPSQMSAMKKKVSSKKASPITNKEFKFPISTFYEGQKKLLEEVMSIFDSKLDRLRDEISVKILLNEPKNPQKDKVINKIEDFEKPFSLIRVGKGFYQPSEIAGIKHAKDNLYILILKSYNNPDFPIWMTDKEVLEAFKHFNVCGIALPEGFNIKRRKETVNINGKNVTTDAVRDGGTYAPLDPDAKDDILYPMSNIDMKNYDDSDAWDEY